MMKSTAATAGLTGLCVTALAAACAPAPPPAELAGLWSAGPAACEAGVGVRFARDAIAAIYEDETHTLFERPDYEVAGEGAARRIRIEYSLPRPVGGAHSAGARGVITLQRGEDGFLKPTSHNLLDGRTGSARVRIGEDPALAALSLTPCGAHPWREALRGRDGN